MESGRDLYPYCLDQPQTGTIGFRTLPGIIRQTKFFLDCPKSYFLTFNTLAIFAIFTIFAILMIIVVFATLLIFFKDQTASHTHVYPKVIWKRSPLLLV